MSTVGIIEIHDEISRTNGQCCCICFRPGTERRLVEPKYLNSLMSKLAYVIRFQFQHKFQVCYICEALAHTAVEFVKAVEVAARVSDLFSEISNDQWQDIAKHLGSDASEKAMVQQMNKDSPPRRALRLDRQVRSSPRYQLLRTDTLVVTGGVTTSDSTSASGPTRSQPSKDLVVVMQHEEQPNTLPVKQPMLPMMSPIAVPNLPQKPGLSTLPQLSIDPDHKHMRVFNNETNEYILHPMVTGVDGNIYVPTLQLQILDNGLLKSIDAAHMRRRLPSLAPKPPNNPPSTSNLNSTKPSTVTKRQMEVASTIERNKENGHYQKFLMSQMRQKRAEMHRNNVDVIKMNDLNIVLNVDDCDDNTGNKKQKLSEQEQTLSQVEHILSKNAQGACEIKYELMDDEDAAMNVSSCNQMSASGNQVSTGGYNGTIAATSGAGANRMSPSGHRVLAGGARVSASGNHGSASKNVAGNSSKEPVLRTDRTVDWEDKIPMDVISFMDATDPNPQERIMQPPAMGFISDVRSVPASEIIECIDLC